MDDGNRRVLPPAPCAPAVLYVLDGDTMVGFAMTREQIESLGFREALHQMAEAMVRALARRREKMEGGQ
jgi:hypothetical protein